jgi:hypothetical protein
MALQGKGIEVAVRKAEGFETELNGNVEPFEISESRLHDGCFRSWETELAEGRRE